MGCRATEPQLDGERMSTNVPSQTVLYFCWCVLWFD